MTQANQRIIQRLPAVMAATGLSRSTVYLRISQGLWTTPISLSGRAVGWPMDEVAKINSALIAGKTTDEIRALVKELESSRKMAA